jgi:ubiquitin C-terminal hydrolase
VRTFGIQNIGNTCYANTAFQLFFQMIDDGLFNNNQNNDIYKKLNDIYSKYKSQNNTNTCTEDIKNFIIRYVHSINKNNYHLQNDNSEIIISIIDNLVKDNNIKDKLKILSKQTKYVYPNDTYECIDTIINRNTDTLYLLPIHISKENNEDININSLIIDKFNIGDTSEENDIRCYNAINKNTREPKYNNNGVYNNKGLINHTYNNYYPEFLLVNTILFNNSTNKILKNFIVNKEININNNIKYKLQGVCVHIGMTKDSGHYIYLKYENNMWIEYSDETVKPLGNRYNDIESHSNGNLYFRYTNSPYILYYKKDIS